MSVKRERIVHIAETLAARFPLRNVTRSFVLHTQRRNQDLTPGIYTVIATGVNDYPYEAADDADGVNAPSQTALGDLRFVITGQILLPEQAGAEAVQDAELAMLEEIETFADEAIADDDLVTLRLLRTVTSQQIETPYGWIHSEWQLPLWE